MAVEGWDETELSTLGTIVTGKTPSTKNPNFWGGDIPFVTPTDLKGNKHFSLAERFISDEALKNVKKPLPQGSVMVTCIASIGKMAIASQKCLTNQQINSIIPNTKIIPEFLYYALLYRVPELKNMAGTTAVPIVNKNLFSKIMIDLPPLPEQKQIAEILGSVDEAIAKTEAVIAQTQRVKQGLLQQLLTRGIGHTKFKQTEIGEIPESWEVITFGNHLDVRSGKGFKLAEYSEDGLRLLRIDNVSWGEIIWDSIAFLPRSYKDDYPDLTLEEGDMLLALNRPITQGKLKFAKLTDKDLPAILYQRVGKILFNDLNEINKDYGYHLLSHFLVQFVNENSVGSDQPFINITKLRKMLLPQPPLEEQKRLARVLDSVDLAMSKNNKLLEGLIKTKKGLMSDLLKGRVRVNTTTSQEEAA